MGIGDPYDLYSRHVRVRAQVYGADKACADYANLHPSSVPIASKGPSSQAWAVARRL